MTQAQWESIYEDLKLHSHYFTWQIGNKSDFKDKESFILNYISYNMSNEQEKTIALMQNQGFTWDDAEHEIDNEWLVCTDDEADSACKESAESYLDDVVMCEINSVYHQYFNKEQFIDDFLQDGRGHILNHWDGNEETENVNGTTYYIYRQ